MGRWTEYEVTGEAIEFKEVRLFSPQWEVRILGVTPDPVARVTERYVAEPAYAVAFIDPDRHEREEFFNTRDEVHAAILKHVNFDPKSLAGQANCGCHYHAEDGIPCEHDLALARKVKL